MTIKIVGDLHLRREEPFFSAAKNVLDNLIKTSRTDLIIFAGDFFHTSRPYTEELKTARDFFEQCRQKYIEVKEVAGNHTYYHLTDVFAENQFDGYDMSFIDTPNFDEFTFGDKKIALVYLPWISKYRLSKLGYSTMREYYEGINKTMCQSLPKDIDDVYLIYHFEDETQSFFADDNLGVDLTIYEKTFKNVIRLGGHIHVKSKNYIGTPYVTRKDENGQECTYIEIKDGVMNEVPVKSYIEYKNINYDNLKFTRFDKEKSYILTVENGPSRDLIYDLIKDKPNLFINDFSLLSNEERSTEDSKEFVKDRTIKEYLEMYILQNKVDKNTAEYLKSLF